jgi:DNA-binding LacI/PurR family transcriptional regulator
MIKKYKYLRFAELLEEEIYCSYLPGQLFPSQETLAERFSCNRATINKAVSELAERGLLLQQGRKGTFVADFINSGFDPHLLALVMPLRSHMWDRLYLEMSCISSENNYFTLAVDTSAAAEKQPDAEAEMFRRLKHLLQFRPRNVVVSTELDINYFLEKLGNARRKFRNLIWLHDRDITDCPDTPLGQVSMDMTATWRLVAENALRSGYRDICLFVQNISFMSDALKVCVRNVLAEAGINDVHVHCFNEDNLQDSLNALVKLARINESLAVICTYDYGAHLVSGALRSANIQIPDKVGIYGVNNTPWSEQDNLTSIGFDYCLWSNQIIECINQLEHDKTHCKLSIPPQFIQRASTRHI